MAKIARDEIIEACLNGISYSFEEYLLTINIAKKLSEIPNNSKFITLEDNDT